MRRLFVLFLALSLSIAPCIGCGDSKPDPRDNPDFEEDSNPDIQAGALGEDPGADAPATE